MFRKLFQKKGPKFKTNEEYFLAIQNKAEELENRGLQEAAQKLRDGLSCLNGLTDGWALLMDAIKNAMSAKELNATDLKQLKEMHSVAKKIVHRR